MCELKTENELAAEFCQKVYLVWNVKLKFLYYFSRVVLHELEYFHSVSPNIPNFQTHIKQVRLNF